MTDRFDVVPGAPLPAGAHAMVDAAEEATDAWTASLLRTAIKHLARTRAEFTSDDLEREAIDHKPNQLGAAIRAAHTARIITPTGNAVCSTRPEAHGRLIRTWTRHPDWSDA